MDDGRFYRVDNAIHDRYAPLVGVYGWAIYSHLCRRAYGDEVSVAYPEMMRALDIASTATVAKYVARLAAVGLIETLSSFGQVGHYRLRYLGSTDAVYRNERSHASVEPIGADAPSRDEVVSDTPSRDEVVPTPSRREGVVATPSRREVEVALIFGNGTSATTSRREVIQDSIRNSTERPFGAVARASPAPEVSIHAGAPADARAQAIAAVELSDETRETLLHRKFTHPMIEEGLLEWRDVRSRNAGLISEANAEKYLTTTFFERKRGQKCPPDDRDYQTSKRNQGGRIALNQFLQGRTA